MVKKLYIPAFGLISKKKRKMEDFPWTFQLENFDTGRLFAARNYGQEYNLGTFGPICAETRHRAIRGEELKKY